MGCDIHQYNMIYQDDGSYVIEGEGFVIAKQDYQFKETDECIETDDDRYFSKYIPQLIPGRNYDLFGILAGVRAYEFEIDGEQRHDGYPDSFEDLASKNSVFKERISERHSPVWYYLPDLTAALHITVKEILKERLELKQSGLTSDWIEEDIEHYDCLCGSVERIIERLKTAEQMLGDERFNRSIVVFNFDS